MRLERWFSWLGVGTLVLSGMLVAGPLAGAQDATPAAAETAAQPTEDDNGDNGTSVVGTPLLEPAIDFIRAQEIALEGQTGAAVTDIELGGDNGVLVYSVTLDSGSEVKIDATSGEVVETEAQDAEQGEGNADEDRDSDQKGNGNKNENKQDDDDENGGDES
jgi:hypothetical protein